MMTNHLDDAVVAQMREHRIPGLSFAVINNSGIAPAFSYGFAHNTSKSQVNPSTLFQAASVSKCLTSLAALRLVDQGRLFLDEDVNAKLLSWKIPPCDFTKNEPVTLRRLLSHNAGVSIHGFRGYASGQRNPTLLQGVAIMINANAHPKVLNSILKILS